MTIINSWRDYKSLPGIDNVNKQFLNAKEIFSEEQIGEANKWAKFWFFEKGLNTFPGDTKHKMANMLYHWNSQGIYYQNNPIPIEIFNTWLEIGLFAFGICVVAGKCFRGPNEGGHVNVIDYDNEIALEQICIAAGFSKEELYQKTLVEGHDDDPGRGHIYVESNEPWPIKPSDKNTKNKDLLQKFDENKTPLLEVKPQGLLFSCNSTHENGHQYKTKGTLNIWKKNDFYHHVDNVCKRYHRYNI